MDALLQDIRYGFRQLLRQRGSSLVAIVTLGLGIGVSTAIFSVIDVTMLRPLPFPDPDQLVKLLAAETQPNGKVFRLSASMEDLRTWQQSNDLFSFVAGWGATYNGRIVEGAEPHRVEVANYTEDYLPMHGVTPMIGRNFTREDTDPGAALVALLGYRYWQTKYNSRQDVAGQTVRFDTEVAAVIGVLPPSFNVGTSVVLPLRVAADMYSQRGTGRVSVYARLRPGVTIEQASERASVRMPGRTLPDGTAQSKVEITSRLEEAIAGYATTVRILTSAVALILLIACVNVAGLLLARGAARQSELAARASMGAGRGRLIQQLLTESLLLTVCGGALGLGLAWLSLDAIAANLPLYLPSDAPIRLNVRVLGAAAALLVPTTLIIGLVPAIRLSRVHLGSALARGGRQRGTSLSRRGGQLLIAVEVALAVILVAGAGLMVRSFLKIADVDLGFARRGLLVMNVMPLERDPVAQRDYYDALLQQARTLPGIAAAGIVDNFALDASQTMSSVSIAGARGASSSMIRVTPGYFETIGATLVSGRLPTRADDRGVVVNEIAAREAFGNAPLGREFTSVYIGDKEPWTVIGVIRDVRVGGPLWLPPRAQIYFPLKLRERDVNRAMVVVVRPTAEPAGLGDQLRRVAASIGPRVLVERIRTSEQLFGDTVLTPRQRTVLLGLLGGLGLALALVGVFGMTAYSVTRRTAEIGVRMAFGARPGQVVGTMLRDSVWPIAIGTAVGVGGAVLATRAIKSFLFGTEPTDPATLIVVAATLAVSGCVAALVPSLRAAKVDPVTSLRAE